MNEMPKIMTLKTAAKYVDMRPRTMMKYIHHGSLRAKKIGCNWYVDRDELQRFFYPMDEEQKRKVDDFVKDMI